MSRNFDDLLADLGIARAVYGQHHHARKGWVQFDCPFCSPGSGRMRMGYNIRGGYCNCWTCGRHGAGEVVAKLASVPYGDAVALLKGLTPTRTKTEPLRRGRLVLPGGIGELHSAHKRYLRARGFNVSRLLALWGIRGIDGRGRLKWRVFIPALLDGKVVSWTTRSISDNVQSRYISAGQEEESVPLKHILYGEQYCHHKVVIVEGPLDVWAIGPGAVATCGVGYSMQQLLRIAQYPVRVVCFDNEPDAQRRASKLCADLAVFEGDTYNVTLDSGKDASRASKEEVKHLRKEFLDS